MLNDAYYPSTLCRNQLVSRFTGLKHHRYKYICSEPERSSPRATGERRGGHDYFPRFEQSRV